MNGRESQTKRVGE